MKRPTERELAAIADVSRNKEFVDWLRASLEACQDNLILQQDETLLRQAQGEGRAIREILRHMAEAPEIISRKAR